MVLLTGGATTNTTGGTVYGKGGSTATGGVAAKPVEPTYYQPSPGFYVDVSIPLQGAVAQQGVATSVSNPYYGGATTNTTSTNTNNNTNNNTTEVNNNNTSNNVYGSGVRYTTSSFTPTPAQPRKQLQDPQLEAYNPASPSASMLPTDGSLVNISKNYGGPVTSQAPSGPPLVGRDERGVLQGVNTANTVRGYDARDMQMAPQTYGMSPQQGMGYNGAPNLSPQVVQAMRNQAAVQKMMYLQAQNNPQLQAARANQATGMGWAGQMAAQPQFNQAPPVPYGAVRGFRGAMQRAAAGLSPDLAKARNFQYEQANNAYIARMQEYERNRREGLQQYMSGANSAMQAETSMENNLNSQATNIVKATLATGNPGHLLKAINDLQQNFTTPESHAQATYTLANAMEQSGGFSPEMVDALRSTAGQVSEKAVAMQTGREVRNETNQFKLNQMVDTADMQSRKLAAQVGILEFKAGTQEYQQKLYNTKTMAQIGALNRGDINAAIAPIDNVLRDYSRDKIALDNLRGSKGIFMKPEDKAAAIASREKEMEDKYGAYGADGLPKKLKDLYQQRDFWGSVLGANAQQPAQVPVSAPRQLVNPPQAPGLKAAPAQAMQAAPTPQGIPQAPPGRPLVTDPNVFRQAMRLTGWTGGPITDAQKKAADESILASGWSLPPKSAGGSNAAVKKPDKPASVTESSLVAAPKFKPPTETVLPYTTRLAPQQESAFRQWVVQNQIPFDANDPRSDYDMRGYWNDVVSRGASQTETSAFDGQLHFPDTYKTPYHKTFSNESKYAPPDAPRWLGNKLVDKDGRVIADETPPSNEPQAAPAQAIQNPDAIFAELEAKRRKAAKEAEEKMRRALAGK